MTGPDTPPPPPRPKPTAARPTLADDSPLWQFLKAYAHEDWSHLDAPWPAPVETFLAEASRREAHSLASEIAALQALGLADVDWRALLTRAHIDAGPLAPAGDLAAWADDLRRRAAAA